MNRAGMRRDQSKAEGHWIPVKRPLLTVLLSILYSVVYAVIGPMLKEQSHVLDARRLLGFLLCFLVSLAENFVLFSIAPQQRFGKGNERIGRALNRLGDRGFFWLVWALLFVSWIPAYLLLYPGVLAYDMISQVGSALGEITNNHHPILHTWLLRVFLRWGYAHFSSYEAGLGLLSLLQMLVLSYALARLVLLLKKRDVPPLLVVLTALLAAFWFANACLSVTMVKDTLHAAFLVLFACHFAQIAENVPEYAKRKRNLLLLPIIAFLMCALRNNGIHIYVLCFACLLLLRIRQIRRVRAYPGLIVSIALPILLYQIYTGPVFAALGIEQTQIREALCIPIQQLQRVAVHREDELTDEQMEQIRYYIAGVDWMEYPPEVYNPFHADPAKSCFVSANYEKDPAAFWRLYLRIGAQFPGEYAEAFLSNTLGDWYPGYYEYAYVEYGNYEPEWFAVPLERKSLWNPRILAAYYESVCKGTFWRRTPILRFFFVPGFTFWFLLYGMVLAWKGPRTFSGRFPLFLPLIAQYGILLLSPMASFRYAWPFDLLLPVALIAIYGNGGGKNEGKEAPERAEHRKGRWRRRAALRDPGHPGEPHESAFV